MAHQAHGIPCLRSSKFLSRFFVSLVSLLAFTSAFATAVIFNIPAQSAPDAIRAFIKQANVQVTYRYDDLKEVRTNEVKGEMEPVEALTKLVSDTGIEITKTSGNGFALKKSQAKSSTGSVRGNLARETGAPAEGVKVMINETGQQSMTDQYGAYSFGSVEPGTYLFVATSDGYQPLHITGVVVRAGNELTLSTEKMHVTDGTLNLEPYVVHAESIENLEKIEVTSGREKPFQGANVDIPRTINDVQPYYIFDTKTIEQSGATNIEDLLKQRLTMNTVAQTGAQTAGSLSIVGNTSSINLRGLGTNETLVLVNGRRAAGVSIQGTYGQPDLNGIPLSAVDRIEVLPSSASGIYGGSAIGGVVNIILKKDYTGGEIRLSYDNTFNSDAPIRTASASYGFALEGGKTHVTLGGSWSDANSLLLNDRRGIYESNIATIEKNAPTYFSSLRLPWLGELTNITPASRLATTLTLKDGTVLNSRNTYIAAGTSASTSTAALYSSLLANAGSWNLGFPDTSASPTGLLQPLVVTPETKTFMGSIRRQMLPNLELFADFSYTSNRSSSDVSPFNSIFAVPASAPTNPFNSTVYIRFPDATSAPNTASSVSRGTTFGALAHLPKNWTGEFDFTWSKNNLQSHYFGLDGTVGDDVYSGLINPFVDTLRYPLNLAKYLAPISNAYSTTLSDFALRASGPLPSLPWGEPTLTVGIEHRKDRAGEGTLDAEMPIFKEGSYHYKWYPQNAVTDSGYAEADIPLAKKDWVPAVHLVELQLAGRKERYTVDTGTSSVSTNFDGSQINYNGVTVNGQPYFTKTSYGSNDYTAGIKYQPIAEVTLRISTATAFLPPNPSQLIKNTVPDPYPATVTDPKTGNSVGVSTLSGGNSDLKPQNSKSANFGLIWEPQWKPLQGLRLDAEYYRIKQFNYISALSAQQIVNEESVYPGRVTRDSGGNITQVDTSYLNLYHLDTEGWDLNADYSLKTGVGIFNFHATESIITHLRTQYALGTPEYDAAGYSPQEGGSPKYKTNATLTWDWGHWTAGWSTTYFSSYKVNGAAGGPSSLQYADGGIYSPIFGQVSYVVAQGGDTVSSQIYNDLFLGYTFGKRFPSGSRFVSRATSWLNDLTVQFGVRNVFNKTPPLDVGYDSNYYLSPYGDTRLRHYWISLKKEF